MLRIYITVLKYKPLQPVGAKLIMVSASVSKIMDSYETEGLSKKAIVDNFPKDLKVDVGSLKNQFYSIRTSTGFIDIINDKSVFVSPSIFEELYEGSPQPVTPP